MLSLFRGGVFAVFYTKDLSTVCARLTSLHLQLHMLP